MSEFKKINLLEFLNRENIFLAIVLILFLIIIIKMIPPIPITMGKNIKMSILKQNGTITNIDTQRNISSKMEMWINTINFNDGQELIHKDLGPLGYNSYFFLDFDFNIKVKIPGYYDFIIYSDDGFRLFINSNVVCEYISDRPISNTTGQIFLDRGIYKVYLTYFQGYGLLGLRAYYHPVNSKYMYLFGKNSKYIEFLKP